MQALAFKAKININAETTVQLTEDGIEYLKAYWASGGINQNIPGLKENSYTAPLWEIMNIFGSQMVMGFQQLIVKNALHIDDGDINV